jgi:hypothetical protein
MRNVKLTQNLSLPSLVSTDVTQPVTLTILRSRHLERHKDITQSERDRTIAMMRLACDSNHIVSIEGR